MAASMIIPRNAVQEDDSEQSKINEDDTYEEFSRAQGTMYFFLSSKLPCLMQSRFSGINTTPSLHAYTNLNTESDFSASFPHLESYVIQEIILAVSPSCKVHLEQLVALVVPINGFSSVVGIKVYMPQCMENHPCSLGFWCAIDILSESAYLIAHDDDTRIEFQQLLSQLSSWAVAFLPVMNKSETKSKLKLLSFLGSHVLLVSGAYGCLFGWNREGWLVSPNTIFIDVRLI
jgi:hypothetical protein